ncbi:MAG: hypothetical protein WDM91_15360 [Rhizomicrobium sp.]
MSQPMQSFDGMLRRTLEIERLIEAEYLKTDIGEAAYPRPFEKFLKCAKAVFPKLDIALQRIDKPFHTELVRAITLLEGPWRARVILNTDDDLGDEYTFVVTRSVFEVILKNTLPPDQLETPGAVTEINLLIDNLMSENLKELNTASLLDTLSDAAAAEFLFPFRERLKIYAEDPDRPSVREAARRFGIPIGIARYYLNPAMITTFQDFPLLSRP